MSFVNVSLSDAKEPKAVPEGEYDLRIISAEDKESKKGNPMTEVKIAIEGEDAYPIRHFITYPDGGEHDGMKLLEIKRFLECFGIAYDDDGFDTEDLPGATGRSLVVQEEGDNGVIYNRLRLPRLKE